MSINMGPIMLAIMSQTLCQYIFILFNKTFSSCYCYSLVHHLAVQFCAYDVLMDVVLCIDGCCREQEGYLLLGHNI